MKQFLAIVLLATLTSVGTFARAESSSLNDGNTNFRFDPILLLVGAISLHLDFKMNEQWTLGPELAVWKFDSDFDDATNDNYDVTFFSAGVRANWFKNGVHTDGLYIGPSLNYYDIKATVSNPSGSSADGRASGIRLGAVAGYGWFWKSFNQMLGLGATVAVGDSHATVEDSTGKEEDVDPPRAGISLEYTLGWTF